jgi:tRNA U38,U39,U40 pseudouridine synthase TruA
VPRYFIELAYHGKNFHGFAQQLEGNPRTVQGEIERVLHTSG